MSSASSLSFPVSTITSSQQQSQMSFSSAKSTSGAPNHESSITSSATAATAARAATSPSSSSLKDFKPGYKLICPPTHFKSEWWNYYYIYCPIKHPKKELKDLAICRLCKIDISIKGSRTGLRRHIVLKHAKEVPELKKKEQEKAMQQRKLLFNQLKATPKISKQQQEINFKEAAVAWIVEKNLPFSSTEKKSFCRMIESVCPQRKKAPVLSRESVQSEIKILGTIYLPCNYVLGSVVSSVNKIEIVSFS